MTHLGKSDSSWCRACLRSLSSVGSVRSVLVDGGVGEVPSGIVRPTMADVSHCGLTFSRVMPSPRFIEIARIATRFLDGLVEGGVAFVAGHKAATCVRSRNPVSSTKVMFGTKLDAPGLLSLLEAAPRAFQDSQEMLHSLSALHSRFGGKRPTLRVSRCANPGGTGPRRDELPRITSSVPGLTPPSLRHPPDVVGMLREFQARAASTPL